jgi:hypothetical protein
MNRLYQNGFIGPAEDFVYNTIAKYRRYLPGVTPRCRDHPNDCEEVQHRRSTR